MNSEANLLLSDTQGTPCLAALLFSTLFDSMVAYFTLDFAMPLLGAFSNDDNEEYFWSSIVIVSTAGRVSLAALSASLVLSDSPAKFQTATAVISRNFGQMFPEMSRSKEKPTFLSSCHNGLRLRDRQGKERERKRERG